MIVKAADSSVLGASVSQTPSLQTAVMVMTAQTAHPSLFADVDVNEMFRMPAEEAAGAIPTGIWFYTPAGHEALSED